jgi:hypothetical protein
MPPDGWFVTEAHEAAQSALFPQFSAHGTVE